MGIGDDLEAQAYVIESYEVWKNTEGAVKWLKSVKI